MKINKDTRGYSKNKNPEEVLPVVNVFGESAKEIASLKIEDQKIKDYQKDLTKIYEGYGEATNDFIEAINNRDVDTALSSKFKVEQVNKKEKEIVQQINEYCRNK